MSNDADTVREALGLFYSMAASGEKPSPRSEYVRDESRAALDALVAERDEARRERDKALLSVEGLSKRLTIAVAAEAEIVRLRAELGER